MKPEVFSTKIVLDNSQLVPCKVTVVEDRLIIIHGYWKKTRIEVQFGTLSSLLFEDTTTTEGSMAGFGVNYDDSKGSFSIYFLNDEFFPVSRARKLLAAVKKSHSDYYSGTSVPELVIHDTTKKKTVGSAVRRNR